MSGRTDHYFLTKLDVTEGVHDERGAYPTTDRDTIDHLLHVGAETHRHSGDVQSPVVEPSVAPNLTIIPDGTMPAGTRLYYVNTFISPSGLESAPSPEAYIDIPAPIEPPVAPLAILETDAGSLSPGDYYYALTAVEGTPVAVAQTLDPDRETELGEPAYIRIAVGTANAQITLEFPEELPAGAAAYNLYRRQPGDQLYQFMATILDPTTPFTDDGTLLPTLDRNPPALNQTNANLGVIVELGEELPGGYTWRLYRSAVSGHYDASLVAEVTESITAEASVVLSSLIDDGNPPYPGTPPERTLLVSNPSKILLTDGAEVDGRLPSSMIAELPIVQTLSWTAQELSVATPPDKDHWIEYNEVALLGGRLRASSALSSFDSVTVEVYRSGASGETLMFTATLPQSGFFSTAMPADTESLLYEGDRLIARVVDVGDTVGSPPDRLELVVWYELRSYLPPTLSEPDIEVIWADPSYRNLQIPGSQVFSPGDTLKEILEGHAAPNTILGLQPGVYEVGGPINVDLLASHPNEIGFGRFGGSCLIMPCDQWGNVREDFREQVIIHGAPSLDPADFTDCDMDLGYIAFAGIVFVGRTSITGHHVVLYDLAFTYPVDLWAWLAAKKIGVSDVTGWVDGTQGDPADPAVGMGVPVPLTLRDLTHAQIWGIDTWGGDGIVIDGGLTDSVLESLSVTIQADGDTDETLQLDSDVNGNTPPPTYARADIDPFTQLGLRGIQIRKGPITGVTVDHVAMNGSWQVTDWDGATGAAIVDLAFSEAWIHHTASYAVQHTAIAPDSNPGSYGIGGRLADVTIWQNGGPSWRQDRWGNGSVTQAAVVEPYVTPVDQSGRSRVMVAPATSTDSDPSSSVVVGVPRLIAAGLSAVDVQRSPRQPALQWRFTAKDLFELTGWSRTV